MSENKKGSVLIIDDELGPRESIRIVLGGQHECVVAENGRHGLELLEKNPVDLVILDIKMPGIDGIETLRRIKEKRPDVMVVLLTGFGTLDTAQKAIRLGAFDYLKKPFDIDDLRDVVQKGLSRKFDQEAEKARVDDLERITDRMKNEMSNFDRMTKLGTLSAGIIHEMKNPLTVILGYTQMILAGVKQSTDGNELKLSEKSLKYLNVIEKETMRCADIAKKLLEVSKASKDTFAALDIREIIANTEVLIQPQCSVNQIFIRNEVPEAPLYANVIQSTIHDILLNLCFNAIQAMTNGGKIVISSAVVDRDGANLSDITAEEKEYMSRQSAEGYVSVAVEDAGAGIPDENIKKIFEPFFTTKDGETGTGLGLPLAKEKAKKNSGNLSLVRTGPGGTIFRLLLPKV